MNISCIIPTKDRCRMVLEALESVRSQKYPVSETIVVDDGSTDNTLPAIRSAFPEVTVLQLDPAGPGVARNIGAAGADGDIFMFLDSDDIWLDDHVQRLVHVLERGFEVAYGVTVTRDEIRGNEFLTPDNGTGPEGDCFDSLVRWCFLVPSSMAVSREAFKLAGGFMPVACGEDWMFFLKLAARFPFGFVGPRPITVRRLHEGSLCFLADDKKPLAIISQLLTVLESEPRSTMADRMHLERVRAWTAENSAHWATIQDWFLALQREKFI